MKVRWFFSSAVMVLLVSISYVPSNAGGYIKWIAAGEGNWFEDRNWINENGVSEYPRDRNDDALIFNDGHVWIAEDATSTPAYCARLILGWNPEPGPNGRGKVTMESVDLLAESVMLGEWGIGTTVHNCIVRDNSGG